MKGEVTDGQLQSGQIFQREKRGDLGVVETGGDPFRTMKVEQAKRAGSGKWERVRTSPRLEEKNSKEKGSTVPTMGEVEEAAV